MSHNLWASVPVIGIAFTQEVLVQLVTIGVWCAVSARRIVAPVLFNKKLISKGICVHGQHFQHL
jgi:hypothetical protein